MLNSLIWWSFPALLLGACAFAWLKGSPAERYASLLILAADAAADASLAAAYPRFPGLSMCLIDLALAAGLLLVALKYSSIWLGAAMLLQSVALCLQALNLGDDGPSTGFHVVLNDAISYAMLLCIMAGTATSWRARRRGLARQGSTAAVALTHPA